MGLRLRHLCITENFSDPDWNKQRRVMYRGRTRLVCRQNRLKPVVSLYQSPNDMRASFEHVGHLQNEFSTVLLQKQLSYELADGSK